MRGYKVGRHRRLRGNVSVALTAVVLTVAVLGAAFALYRRGTGAGSSSSAPPSSSSAPPSSSVPPSSSSSQATSSSAAPSSSEASSSSSDTSSVSPTVFQDDIFVGDSLTDGLALYGEMDDATVMGETGMSAYTALKHTFTIDGKKQYVADAVAAASPKAVYVLLGSNDIAEGYSVAKYTGFYGQLLDEIHAKCPSAKLYVQSVFPVTAAYEHKKFSSGVYMTNAKIDDFNTALQTLASAHGAVYLDVASVLKGPDGKLPTSASDDGMHLHKSYYDKWFQYLAAHR